MKSYNDDLYACEIKSKYKQYNKIIIVSQITIPSYESLKTLYSK